MTYAEYRKVRQDMKDYQTAKYNVDQFLKRKEEEKGLAKKKKRIRVYKNVEDQAMRFLARSPAFFILG